MRGRLKLSLLTPTKPVLNCEADMVIARCAEGDIGILPGHERFVGRLVPGMLRVHSGGELIESLFVLGGTLHVSDNNVVVLTPIAGGREDVKAELGRMEQERAERQRDERRSDANILRAEVALRNALVQMDVSAYSVLRRTMGEDYE